MCLWIDDISHKPGAGLPLLTARPMLTLLATVHHRHLASTKLYCLVTETCEQLGQSHYMKLYSQDLEL